MRHRFAFAIVISLVGAPAIAEDARRLTPAQIEQVLQDAARKRAEAERAPPPRAIEGEVGVSIGTGGYREVFGTAVVPVGNDATAIISVGNEQSDRRPRRRR